MKTLITCLFVGFMSALSVAQKPVQQSHLFKMSVGGYRFKDHFTLVDKIQGYSFGITYERLVARHWSIALGLEYCVNDNAIHELKTLFNNINLPDKEHRFAFSYDFRYYLKQAGSGLYFGNAIGFQKLKNAELIYGTDCINCPNNGYSLHDTYALSDRLTFGYQELIDNKWVAGISVGYEFRVPGFYRLISSPQISIQLGFAK
jgi:hypothetical protein